MAGSSVALAQEWNRRWLNALAQAMAPERKVTLTQGELLRTGESGMFANVSEFSEEEVAMDDVEASGRGALGLRLRPFSEWDTGAWLRRLVADASTLQERLDTTQMSPVSLDEGGFIQAQLGRWARRVGFDDDGDTLDRYFQYQGLDSSTARRAVVSAQLREGTPLPGWAATLGEALFTPCYDALPGACDPERPIPFESLLLPFAHIYLQRVKSEASKAHQVLAPTAQYPMVRPLLEVLSTIARDLLYAEFCRYRLTDFAPLSSYVSLEPDALYRRFVDQMQAAGFRTLCEVYPVLSRRLAIQTDLFAAAVGEFLRRLEADLPEIFRLWEMADPGPVTSVAAGLSDPHRGGRQVFAVTFMDGNRLIYKPKDLGIDVAYNGLLAWLNAAGAPVTLRPLRVLDRQTHGWVECVEHATCADWASIARYYQRAGALMCLVYLLQGSDCHNENLIAAGEDPVLVDCETLLNPWPRAIGWAEDGDRRRSWLDRLMRDSVLTTGLLPSLGDHDERVFSPPGLCRTIVLSTSRTTNRWMRINTDGMVVGQVAIRPGEATNLPHVDGIPAEVGENVEPLIAGFAAMYRFLMSQRLALLSSGGPLSAFRGQFVRFLFRGTHLYSVLSGLALRSTALSDGVDHSLHFEPLARIFLASNQSPLDWSILASERAALLRGDVPFFGARTDQAALLLEEGERIEDFFTGPSYDAVEDKLRNLSEQDLTFQEGLIRAAIGVYGDLLARAPKMGPASVVSGQLGAGGMQWN